MVQHTYRLPIRKPVNRCELQKVKSRNNLSTRIYKLVHIPEVHENILIRSDSILELCFTVQNMLQRK
jgi:hypothetical protein